MANILIEGDPLDPSSGDLIAQTATLEVGKPVPEGWRVMSGGHAYSQIARVAMRYEIENPNPLTLT